MYYINATISHYIKEKITRTIEESMVPSSVGEEGRPDEAQRIFKAEKLLCDSVMEDTCHYPSVNTHRMYNTQSEPK